MYSLIYVSSSVNHFSTSDLFDLLEKSKMNNMAKDITGILLYKDGNFLQVLEGPKQAVLSTFTTIEKDVRHRGSIVIIEAEIQEREFSGWSMAFRNLNLNESEYPEGYNKFLNVSFTDNEFRNNSSLAHELINLFNVSIR